MDIVRVRPDIRSLAQREEHGDCPEIITDQRYMSPGLDQKFAGPCVYVLNVLEFDIPWASPGPMLKVE